MHSSEPGPEAMQLSEECRKLSGNVLLVSSLIFNLALLLAPRLIKMASSGFGRTPTSTAMLLARSAAAHPG